LAAGKFTNIGIAMQMTKTVTTAAVVLLTLVRSGAGEELRLLDAVKRQDEAGVRLLIKQRADPEARQADGTTALHWAAHRNNLGIARALLQAGAKVNAVNELGVTPLVLAGENGNGDMVTAFLEAGANPNVLTLAGESPLMAAARSGSLMAVAALLKRGADPNAAERTRGQTALMWAVAAQQAGAVRLLLAAGADAHARTPSNRRLVYTGYRYITSPPPESSGTVVEVDLGGFSPILFAAQQGNVEVGTLLLDAGANKDDRSALGQTALIVAAHSNHAGLVKLLLDRGADPNAGDVGYSALHAAVLLGNVEAVKLLLAAKADPNARITKGEPVRKYGQEYALTANLKSATPLWLAARFGEPAIVSALIKGGADPAASTEDGVPAILAAIPAGGQGDRRDRYMTDIESANQVPGEVEHANLDVLKAFQENGVALDATSKTGDTLAHLAAARGYNTIIQFLADGGIDLNAKNARGLTPLGASMARRRFPAAAASVGAEPTPGAEQTPAPSSTTKLLLSLGAR
jgi:ankyrin repeat protein